MTITLSDHEVQALGETLGSVLSDLRLEIADTDMRELRKQLKARLALLEVILGKLDEQGGARGRSLERS